MIESGQPVKSASPGTSICSTQTPGTGEPYPYKPLIFPRLTTEPQVKRLGERFLDASFRVAGSFLSLSQSEESDSTDLDNDTKIPVTDTFTLKIPKPIIRSGNCTEVITELRDQLQQIFGQKQEHQLESHKSKLPEILEGTPIKQAIIDYLKVMDLKLNYYTENHSRIDYATHTTSFLAFSTFILEQLIEKFNNTINSQESNSQKSCDSLQQTDSIQEKSRIRENLKHLIPEINRATLMTCFTPETTDISTLENLLLIKAPEIANTFNTELLYQKLMTIIERNDTESLFSRIDDAAKVPTRDIRKFVEALDEKLIKNEEITKPLRRFHEFTKQVREYLVQVYNNMKGSNQSFEQLSQGYRNQILECAGKSARNMADNRLLLDKVEFYKIQYLIFDTLLGRPSSELKGVSGIKTVHRSLIAEYVFDNALHLPDFLQLNSEDKEKAESINKEIKKLKEEKTELESQLPPRYPEQKHQDDSEQKKEHLDHIHSRIGKIKEEIKKQTEQKTKISEKIFKEAAIAQERSICQGFERLLYDMLTRFAPGLLENSKPEVSHSENPQQSNLNLLPFFGFSSERVSQLSFKKQLDVRFQLLQNFSSLAHEVTEILANEQSQDFITPVFSKVVDSFVKTLKFEMDFFEKTNHPDATSANDCSIEPYLEIMESQFKQAKAGIMGHLEAYRKEYMVSVASTLDYLDQQIDKRKSCSTGLTETAGKGSSRLEIRVTLSKDSESYKDINSKLDAVMASRTCNADEVLALMTSPDGIEADEKPNIHEALEVYKIFKSLQSPVDKRQGNESHDLTDSILKKPQINKIMHNRTAQVAQWDKSSIVRALSYTGAGKRIRSGLKHIFRGFSEKGLYQNIARETHHLRATENHRVSDLIKMDENSHQTLISLTQIALQDTRLELTDKYPGNDRIARLDKTIANMIDRRQGITDSGSCNPMGRFLEIFDAIVGEEMSQFTELRDKLETNFESLHQDFNRVARENYLGSRPDGSLTPAWHHSVQKHRSTAQSFRELILSYQADNKDTQDLRDLLADAFEVYQQSLEYCFDSTAAHHKLPPSRETVRYLQMSMALKSAVKQTGTGTLEAYKFALCQYNDHLDALAMQMSNTTFKEGMKSSTREKNIDRNFTRVMEVAQTESMTRLAVIAHQLMENKDNQALIKELNKKLDQLFNQKELKDFFKKSSNADNIFFRSWNFITRYPALLPGLFMGCAITSMLYTSIATNLMKAIQERSDKLSSLIYGVTEIVNQLSAQSPNITQLANQAFLITGNTNATSCADQMFNLQGSPLNITLNQGLQQLQTESQGLQQSLRATDATGCPNGGLEKFPPHTNINVPNLITTIASIGSGLLACLGGWYQEVKHRTHDANHYSTTSAAFQSLPPELTEALLLKTAQQFDIHDDHSNEIYPGIKAYSSKLGKVKHGIANCVDFFICDPNPKIKGKDIWPIMYFLTFLLRPASMAFQQRPHSYQELLIRLECRANSRIVGTLARMGGYNSAKEFMDVFKSKAYMLGFLIVLKELDMPIAFNEKSSISDYLTIRSMENRFSAALHNLQGQKTLDRPAIQMLRNAYGDVLIDSIIGPDPDIKQLEQEVSTAWSCITHSVCGVAPLITIYTLEALNLLWYTVNPYQNALRLKSAAGHILEINDLTLAEIIEGTFGKGSDAIKSMAEKARKTIKYETTPHNMSDAELICHYVSGGRSVSKIEQSTLLWGIKELINLSMYTNTTLHERDMGIQSINWEALGAFIAYLIKDSTGIAARYAMLSDDETVRTIFSLIDKLDSPLAEYAISKLTKVGLYCPQNIRNTLGDMIDEAVLSSSGNIEEVHRILKPKFDHLRNIGLQNLRRSTRILVDRIETTVLPEIYQWADAEQASGKQVAARAAEVDFFDQTMLRLREAMPRHLVSCGAELSDEAARKNAELYQLSETIGKHGSTPEALIGDLKTLMTQYTKKDIEAFLAEHVLRPLQSIDPKEKAQFLQAHARHIQTLRTNRSAQAVITDQPLGEYMPIPAELTFPQNIRVQTRDISTAV